MMDSPREGANKRGNSSRLTQSFHFFMFEPIFSPVRLKVIPPGFIYEISLS